MLKFNILKKILKHINSIKYKKQMIKNLNPGDVIWAKMPLPKKRLNIIEESHRIRPYLVVHKDTSYIYAYQFSSKHFFKFNNCEEYLVHKNRYNMKKNSYINLTKIHKIHYKNIKSKYISLIDFDLKNIEKRLQTLNRKNSDYNFNINIFISDGDLVSIDNQLYYVYASDNTFLYCFKVFKKAPINNYYQMIIINSKTYFANFDLKFHFKRNSNISIINIAYNYEIDDIQKKKTDYTINKKKLLKEEKKH